LNPNGVPQNSHFLYVFFVPFVVSSSSWRSSGFMDYGVTSGELCEILFLISAFSLFHG